MSKLEEYYEVIERDEMIKELISHIEEFVTNHPKEVNDNYIEVIEKAKKLISK